MSIARYRQFRQTVATSPLMRSWRSLGSTRPPSPIGTAGHRRSKAKFSRRSENIGAVVELWAMSDSLPSLAAGSLPQPDTGLVLRSLFKSLPSGLVKDGFLRHVDKTGSPETFDRISTTTPPTTGRLYVVTEFQADKGRRPGGDMAPCPICSPTSPQFLQGLLIWCEATAAIYAIGRCCGAKLWKDGRLDRAISEFNRAELRRAVEDELLARLPYVPAFRRWLDEHIEIARVADRLVKGFRKKTPRVYAVVKEAFADGGVLRLDATDVAALELPPLVGPSFVRSTFGAEARLERLRIDRLEHLDFGEDELACIDAIDRIRAVEQALALKWLRNAGAEAEKVFAFLNDCHVFLAPANMRTLSRWSEARSAPFRVAAYVEAGRVKVYVYQGKDDWFDRLDGMKRPEPPPPL